MDPVARGAVLMAFPSFLKLPVVMFPVLACAMPVNAQTGFMMDADRVHAFELSASQSFDEGGQPLLVVATSISCRRLVFLKKQNGYEARYRVFMDLRDSKGRHFRGDVWEEKVVVDDYRVTRSPTAASSSRRTFTADPGKYTVNVMITVLNTSLEYKRKKDIKLVSRDSGVLQITEPIFSIPDRGNGTPPRGEIVVAACPEGEDGTAINPSAVYADFHAWPRVAYSIAGSPAGGQTGRCVVATRVTDFSGKTLLYRRGRLLPGDAGLGRYCIEFNIDNFFIGDYKIETVIEGPGTGERGSAEGKFTVLLSRGLLTRHFHETIELLSIVADGKELAVLEDAFPDERIAAWEEFWRKKSLFSSSANGSLREFLVRVKDALRLFSIHGPGWKTDMGRIYIKYGKPDSVVERQGRMLGSTYRLWYYYSRNIVFIFDDAIGSGDYHLVTTRSL